MTQTQPSLPVIGKPAPKAKLRQRREYLRTKLTGRGSTVLSDFGRLITDVPHKNVYPLKLYMVRGNVPAEPLKDFLRERYIENPTKGTLYEVRTYNAGNGRRYVDYVLLQKLTETERVKMTLLFGDVTADKVVRDGKKRRPRLNKDEKKNFDRMVSEFYLEVERKRAAERAEREAGTLV